MKSARSRHRSVRGAAYVEIVVLIGVMLTIALVALKLTVFSRKANEHDVVAAPAPSVVVQDAGASAVAAKPAGSSFQQILAKVQSGQPLTAEEQKELDRLAGDDPAKTAGPIVAAASTTPAPVAPVTKEKKDKKVRADKTASKDLVALMKAPGKMEDKSQSFVKTAFPNMAPDQQRALGAALARKVNAKKDDTTSGPPVAVPAASNDP